MKRVLSAILALLLCLSLGACKEKESNEPTETSPVTQPEDTPGISHNTNTEGLLTGTDIDVAKLQEFIEIVELTVDNWQEHFRVYHYTYSYQEEKVERDDFGEVVSTETITHSGEGDAFGAGNAMYHWYDDVVIELKHKETGELSVYKFGPHESSNDMVLEESLNLDNYECTRIKGKIFYFTFPLGTLPVATYIWPAQQEGMGIPPGALYAFPGTNAVSNTYMEDWLP